MRLSTRLIRDSSAATVPATWLQQKRGEGPRNLDVALYGRRGWTGTYNYNLNYLMTGSVSPFYLYLYTSTTTPHGYVVQLLALSSARDAILSTVQ